MKTSDKRLTLRFPSSEFSEIIDESESNNESKSDTLRRAWRYYRRDTQILSVIDKLSERLKDIEVQLRNVDGRSTRIERSVAEHRQKFDQFVSNL